MRARSFPAGILSGLFLKFTMTGWRAGVGTASGFSIVANGTRTPVFFDQLRGTAAIVTIRGHRFVKITGLELFFNETSAAAIKDDFGSGPNPRDPFGIATLLARLT